MELAGRSATVLPVLVGVSSMRAKARRYSYCDRFETRFWKARLFR
jgi:hypothetical protein